MDVPMEHVSSEDTVPPHPEGSNEETKEESIKVIYLESEKPGKGDEKDNDASEETKMRLRRQRCV